VTAVDGSQGNLAIAQGRVPELDFEQERFRDASAVAADLKEADLAHHAERLSVQRLQHSPLFLGQQASEHKPHLFSQLFSVRPSIWLYGLLLKRCPCCLELAFCHAVCCCRDAAILHIATLLMLHSVINCSGRNASNLIHLLAPRANFQVPTELQEPARVLSGPHTPSDLLCTGDQGLACTLHRHQGDHIGRTELSQRSRSDSAAVSTRRLQLPLAAP